MYGESKLGGDEIVEYAKVRTLQHTIPEAVPLDLTCLGGFEPVVEGLGRVTAFEMGIYPVSRVLNVILLIIIIMISAIRVKQST